MTLCDVNRATSALQNIYCTAFRYCNALNKVERSLHGKTIRTNRNSKTTPQNKCEQTLNITSLWMCPSVEQLRSSILASRGQKEAGPEGVECDTGDPSSALNEYGRASGIRH